MERNTKQAIAKIISRIYEVVDNPTDNEHDAKVIRSLVWSLAELLKSLPTIKEIDTGVKDE